MPSSPSDPTGPGSLSPDEAFALPGNDTHVGILRALWNDFESGRGDNVVSYPELFERVDIDGHTSYPCTNPTHGKADS